MEVISELHGLILSSRGHLSENELKEIQEFVEGRDFTLAIETLCGFLLDRNHKVSPDLFVRIHSLCERLDVDPYLVQSVKAIVVTD
ncbi:MAG TPA: MafI family immunity protein [Candidatus Dormibacteraeota bacterium]|nr:MafI family immunity protein [Candidatus Dormibacteraeota bacterium]